MDEHINVKLLSDAELKEYLAFTQFQIELLRTTTDKDTEQWIKTL